MQQNLVGKIIFACSARATVVELIPFIVVEQSSFALTVVNARGGIHSIYSQTLQLNGPSRWEIVAWHDEPEQIGRVISDLSTMLQDKDMHLTEGAAACAKLTLDGLDRLRTTLHDKAAFYNPDLGEAFGLDDDDSEDEARAAGEAAAEALSQRKVSAELEALFDKFFPPLSAPESQTIVIQCNSPEEVEKALAYLLGGQVGL